LRRRAWIGAEFGYTLQSPGSIVESRTSYADGGLRLDTPLSPALRLGDSFRVLPGPHKNYATLRERIQTLNDAVLGRRQLRMRYRTGRTGGCVELADASRRYD
jgi:hypothetical protein